MTNINGTRDRIVNTDGGGGSGGGGAVTQATSPWVVDDPDTQSALATILTELGNILTQLQATLDVNITNEIEVKNDAGNPLAISGTVSVTEPVSVDDNGGSLTIDGAVSVSNFPATQPVSGTVEVTNDVGNPLPVNGTVSVGNFPSSVEVSNDAGNPLPISGTVSVTEPVSVDATDLDIRDLSSTTDSVTAAINGLPNVVFSQVEVTTGEVAVPASNLANRKTVSVKALAANGAVVYVGETGVTTTTGYELSPGDSIEMDADATVALFAVSASGNQRVSIAEIA